MYFNLILLLFLPTALPETKVAVNKTQIDKYRKDFIRQLLGGIPFRLTAVLTRRLQNQETPDTTPALDDKAIMYYLYNRQYPVESITINDDLSKVNPKLPVKLLVHGWTEHYYVHWCKSLTAAYIKKGHYNVIALDWSSRGDADYISASLAIKPVGDAIGDFIVHKLHRQRKIPLANIHMISHSLGCHLAGMIGQRVNQVAGGKKVGRITALDPAAPYFDFFIFNKDDRLSPDDGDFVDIVHTDGGWLGFRSALGTADFYPNGGTAVQPGCSLLKPDVQYEDLFCSHARSHKFFLWSILHDDVKAVHCENWSKFNSGGCDGNPEVAFGDDAPNDVTGNYFLRLPENMEES